jgi:hypothetical protein
VLYSPRVEHRKGARQRPAHAEPFVAHEEKAAIPGERAAQRAAELVLPQRWHRRVLRIEEVVGVEGVVAVELEQAASKRVGARPGRDVDQRRRLAAEFRGIHRLLDLELLDRVDRGIDHQVVEQLVGDLSAVQQIDVVTRSLPTDVGQRARLLQGFPTRPARRNDHGIAQLGEAEKIAAVERELHDFAVLDDVADLRSRHLQQRQRALHVHLLGQALHAQCEVERERASDLDDDGVCLRLKTAETRFDRPRAEPQSRQKEAAIGIGRPLDHGTGRRMGGDHLRAWQHAADAVANDTADLAGVDLRGNRSHRQCIQHRDDSGPTCHADPSRSRHARQTHIL